MNKDNLIETRRKVVNKKKRSIQCARQFIISGFEFLPPSNDRPPPANSISAPARLGAPQPPAAACSSPQKPGRPGKCRTISPSDPYEDPSTPQQTPSSPGRWAHSVDEPDKYPRVSLCSQTARQQPAFRRPVQRKSSPGHLSSKPILVSKQDDED